MIRALPLLALMGCPLVGRRAYEERLDADGDGVEAVTFGGLDCDDDAAEVNPAADEVVGNGVDEDCDGTVSCWPDADRDGWYVEGRAPVKLQECPDGPEPQPGDCDDDVAQVHPQAPEDVLGEDHDCDGEALCFPDADGDGHGALGATEQELSGATCATVADDCDDADPAAHPGLPELVGNGVDEDCAGGALCPSGDADGDEVCDDVDTCPVPDDGADGDEDGLAAACDADDDDLDADDDGLPDAAEDADLDGELDPGETDPADPDTDDDGICDGVRADGERDGLDSSDACHARWFVDDDGPGGAGTSWATAFSGVADALDATGMRTGDEVWVAAGTYDTVDQGSVLRIPDGITFYGGFAGDEVALDERDPRLNPTRLDGRRQAVHVVILEGGTLDGFWVTGGYAPGPASPAEGAGLLVGQGATGVVRDTVFEGNEALMGSHLDVGPGSTLEVSGCVLAGGTGSSVHVVGALSMRETSILDAGGDAIDVEASGGAELYLVDVQGSGGAGLATSGQGVVVSSTFHDNGTAGVSVTGGGDVLLSSVSFLGNAGAAVAVDGTSSARVENAAAWDNGAGFAGAGALVLDHVCAPGATGTGAVTLSSSPFSLPAVPATQAQPVYLAAGSPCVDAGDDALANAAFGRFGGDWRTLVSVEGAPGDVGAVDPGRHHAPPVP